MNVSLQCRMSADRDSVASRNPSDTVTEGTGDGREKREAGENKEKLLSVTIRSQQSRLLDIQLFVVVFLDCISHSRSHHAAQFI
jgi:hypothetical protein